MRLLFKYTKILVLPLSVILISTSLIYYNGLWKGSSTFEKTKYILYWNSAYGSSDYGFCCGREPYAKFNCRPQKNCFVTNDRNYLSSISDFDAILFHHRTLSRDDLPLKRSTHQRYIFYLLESPSNQLSLETSPWNSFFNWSMTYRLDSDFPILHGRLKPKSNSKRLTIDEEAKKAYGERYADFYTKGKDKMVAWFASNCDTPGRRELLVNALKKHGIKIDIYGDCGTHKCSKRHEAACWKKIESEYKFYLAFENSICKDYMTEKLWNALNHSILPIVLGGGDYTSILPEGSFVEANVQPRALAAKIKSLHSDKQAYTEYFWWKERFSASVLSLEEHGERHCALCDRLYSDESVHILEDLEGWWEKEAKCTKVRL